MVALKKEKGLSSLKVIIGGAPVDEAFFQSSEGRRSNENCYSFGSAFDDLPCTLDVDIKKDVPPLLQVMFDSLPGGAVIITVDMGPFHPGVPFDHLPELGFGDKMVIRAVSLPLPRFAGGMGNGVRKCPAALQQCIAQCGFAGPGWG